MDYSEKPRCKYYEECGGCQLQHLNSLGQNKLKQQIGEKFLGRFGEVEEIKTMYYPYEYRNKIHSTFGYKDKRSKEIIAGMYAKNSHEIINIEKCIIQDKIADEIIKTIKQIMKKYKIEPYNEDEKTGFLRHVLIRTGFKTKEVMVVLVTSSSMFVGKKNFVKILTTKHPEIKTVIMNINDKNTSMILGDKEETIYGPGFIKDTLCGLTFRISSKSFYQINPLQTEVLYKEALNTINFTGDEVIIDAYSGIGTIGLIASKKVKKVIGVELNKDAVKDAIKNAKINNIENVYFENKDAGLYMVELAEKGEKIDVVIMDPPRSGSDENFLSSVLKLKPKYIIYISCNPETQARDLDYLIKDYSVEKIKLVDMFPQTNHVESIVLLESDKI